MAAHDELDVLVEVHRDFDSARGDWALLEEGVPSAFQRFDWLEGWHRWVGAGLGMQVAIAVVRDRGGRPRMLWPLAVWRRHGVRRLVWMGGLLTDYGAPVVAPDISPALLGAGFPGVWEALLAAVGPVDTVQLDRLLPELGSLPSPLAGLGWALSAAASHQAVVGDDWESFYRSRCSAKTRSGHRRKLRKMGREGAVRFERAETEEAVRRILPTAFALKSAHYRTLGVTDHFARAEVRGWLEELTLRTVRTGGPCHLSGLWVGDELWATHLGLVHADTLYVLFPGYLRDERVGNSSAGAALVRQVLQWAGEDPALQVVDFTMGDEPYKDRWCGQTTDMHDLVRAASWRGALHARGARFWRESKRDLKQHPTLFPMLLKLRARVMGGG